MAEEGYNSKGTPVVIDPSRREKKNYNRYFIASDSKFLLHVRRSVPELLEEDGGSGSKFYHPLLWNRFALSLTRERIAGKTSDSDANIDERIRFYETGEHSDILVNLINERLVTYGGREQGERIERMIEGWSKLNTVEAKAMYFDEKAKAYLGGMRDAARVRHRRKKRMLFGGIAALVLTVAAGTAYICYERIWSRATRYAEKKLGDSRKMFKSDVESAVKILEGYEGKFRGIINEEILPEIRSGQMSVDTRSKLESLIDLADDPEVKKALKVLAKMKAARANGKKKEENNETPKKENNEEQY